MSEYALELRGITKQYPLVLANDDIHLGVRWGEVLALVGENGAGKSTLMKIVYGLVEPDRGEIYVDGKRAEIRGPADAIALGIGMVHQHFMLVDPLSVVDNVILGSEPVQGVSIDYRKARAEVVRLIEELGFDLDPDARIEELPVGLQQRVEILKTLYRKARILILDEPTAVLTPQEAAELFRFLRRYVAQGNAAIIITHKLDEVMEVSDRVTVIRDGRVVGTVATQETSPPELARMMVGREVILTVEKRPKTPGEVVLEVQDLRVAEAGKKPRLDGVSFQVRAGEIVGIAGVEGNGQTELVEAVTGLRPYSGTVRYGGEILARPDARRVREWGVSHIPEDRNARGLVLDFPTRDNVILGDHYKPPFVGAFGFFVDEAVNRYAQEVVEAFDVRPRSIHLSARRYSGGNAQKIIVGRELARRPRLLVAAQPTRGVDIGAIEFIHRRIVEARDAGMAVLLVSADLNEVMSLSDRILVMYEGRIVGEVRPGEVTEEELGLMMAGMRANA
ncbi:ABC transporter ATP-binding protein [Marinithermus hydrothermalis]|uniref:Monosaccharide-transporting ATPase n=1 Tax=Marinithermus hydrothermalis (strain DSM 14884 / JCM 11576 / T1) TaxID=869210 RepID=F2NLB7_MARHT|nr:ABC transporter ATP-binding protein [Marinithermus hydrothermalis]AEB11736.1 Monosaccharide-transporting ATPase [Marinithermus hydrothermalis DSM 14884]